MTHDCLVRERRDADLPALATVLKRVHARDGYPVEGVDDPIAWLELQQTLRSWTAVVDGSPIGQVTLVGADGDEDAARSWATATGGSVSDLAIVVRLFVDPDHRSVSAGRLLMTAALDYAHQIGRTVALDVMAKDRAAIRLYERLGALRISDISHRHSGELAEPAIVYMFP